MVCFSVLSLVCRNDALVALVEPMLHISFCLREHAGLAWHGAFAFAFAFDEMVENQSMNFCLGKQGLVPFFCK